MALKNNELYVRGVSIDITFKMTILYISHIHHCFQLRILKMVGAQRHLPFAFSVECLTMSLRESFGAFG